MSKTEVQPPVFCKLSCSHQGAVVSHCLSSTWPPCFTVCGISVAEASEQTYTRLRARLQHVAERSGGGRSHCPTLFKLFMHTSVLWGPLCRSLFTQTYFGKIPPLRAALAINHWICSFVGRSLVSVPHWAADFTSQSVWWLVFVTVDLNTCSQLLYSRIVLFQHHIVNFCVLQQRRSTHELKEQGDNKLILISLVINSAAGLIS